ncbi:MAG TPA: Xaa-Pro peptidase family protein [Tepidisphaeraceae bacterium]|nr:Xaa-Pro peptidase family protein [Tepidisphaeraceae bacterium]
MLTVEHSRQRQRRLLEVMRRRNLDAVVVGVPHHVYYFSAVRSSWLHESAFVLMPDGRAWLTSGNKPAENAAVDEAVSYEAQWHATLRQEQPAVVALQALDRLKSKGGGSASRIGIDASTVTSQLLLAYEGHAEPIDADLWQMRRRKDADELELMKLAIRATEAMYSRARELIEPGIQEISVFTELHAAAVKSTGEPMTAPLGNDYVCGGGGGPPRNGRAAKAGEIYVLDLGPSYRGYFADNCRAFAVGGKPTDKQMNTWTAITDCLELVERLAKPGVRCRDLHDAAAAFQLDRTGIKLPHHLGHGVGLQPHEYPHLNPSPGWDDVLLEGEVFTAEPGLYGPHLNGGIRIENNYLVTASGVKNLLNFPMELA